MIRSAPRVSKTEAFTIVELIIIVVVIAILVTVGAVSYNAVISNSRKQAVKSDAQLMSSTLAKFKSQNGSYSASLSELDGNSLGTARLSLPFSIVLTPPKGHTV